MVGNLATNTVQVAKWWWPPAVWTAAALLALGAVLLEVRSVPSPGGGLEEVAATVAAGVRRHWAQEAALRKVRQPVPLRVRWSSTGRPVAAGRDVVLDESAGAGWRELPLAGHLDEIVEAFRGLPHQQLVVLGEPGAGKSVLAMLLTLGLLERREPGQPVPVLLAIAPWNPIVEHLDAFLIRRLGEDFPILARRSTDGRSLAEQLVVDGRVSPVLDGLDELPTGRHALAVEALDRAAAEGRSLVVTCRSREYEQAVTGSGSVLSRAAVVEIEPVSVEQAIAFLSHPQPARSRWEPVFTDLRQHPTGHLAQALSTPLMVALARSAYQHPTTKPADLLTLPNGAAVTSRLIDGFVTSVYRPDQPPPPRSSATRPLRDYGDSERAARWLSCLAYHLYQAGTRELWWWQISPGLLSPRPKRTIRTMTLIATTIPALTLGFAGGLIAGPRLGLWVAVAAAAVVGLNAVGLFRPLWPDGYPRYVALWYRTPHQQRVHRIRLRAVFGGAYGLIIGLLASVPLLGLAAGLLCGLLNSVVPTWSLPVTAWRSTPALTFRINQSNAITAGMQCGLIGAAVFAAVAWLAGGAPRAATVGCTAGLVYALAGAFGAGLWTWTRFRLVHVRLALCGWLPWSLRTFFDDAHRRGVFRQAGIAWQFRHALLQDHLARRRHTEHLRACADAGDEHAAYRLVNLLVKQGRVDELQDCADAGDLYAAKLLVDLLINDGQIDQAIEILRIRTDAGDRDAAQSLAVVLGACGRVEELRARAHAGDPYAAHRMVDLLVKPEFPILRRRRLARTSTGLAGGTIDAAPGDATHWVVELPAKRDRRALRRCRLAQTTAGPAGGTIDAGGAAKIRAEEAIKILQVCADADDLHAERRLVNLLVRLGRVDQAIEILRTRINCQTWDADHRLFAMFDHAGIDEVRSRARAGRGDAAYVLVDLLARRGSIEEGIEVLRVRASAGDSSAAEWLADVLVEQDRIDELRARAGSGDWPAVYRLVNLLIERGRGGEAVEFLRLRADVGDGQAAAWLADLLNGNGRIGEAIEILRVRADAGDGYAVESLVDLLAENGRTEEAIGFLRARGGAGVWNADGQLVNLLIKHGRADEAIEALQSRAGLGDRDAERRLVDLLLELGRVEEAIEVLEVRADAGLWDAERRLVDLLVSQGRTDELRARAAADVSNRYAAYRLADLLAKQNRVQEAIEVLRIRVDAGIWDAGEHLASLLFAHGRLDDLRARAEAGDWDAIERLADLLVQSGRLQEAIEMLRAGSGAGHTYRLASVLNEHGRVEEAIEILRVRADAGYTSAAYLLVDLLVEHGRIEEAIEVLWTRADAGDKYADWRLDALLDQERWNQ